MGGKACRLAELDKAGFSVPEGAVISEKDLGDALNIANDEVVAFLREISNDITNAKMEKVSKLISSSQWQKLMKEASSYAEELLKKGFPAVAVRSSGNMEDAAELSFAGQFETVLKVKTKEELEKAILFCYASKYSSKVLHYTKNNNIHFSELMLNVIIQGMVPAERAGVLFTINPMTGNDKEMVVEVVEGLGESLVQGNTTPETRHYDWYLDSFNDGPSQGLLTDAKLKELCLIALKIQQHYGEPQDIEWAFEKDTFSILQARPITAIHFNVEDEWTNADLKDGGISAGITTPLMYSLYEYIFERTMPLYFKQIHVHPDVAPKKWFNWFFGFSYWNMKAAKEGVKKIPGWTERPFDQSLGIEPDYEGEGHRTAFTPLTLWNGIKILLATNKSIRKRPLQCKTVVSTIDNVFKNLDETGLASLSDDALIALVEKIVKEDYYLLEGNYFYTIYDNSNATSLFTESLEKYNKKRKEKINYLYLTAGLLNLSHLRPTFDLWKLSRIIRPNKEACDFFAGHNKDQLSQEFNSNHHFAFKKEIKEYILKYKYHSLRELDITVPHWIEDPTQVFPTLKDMLLMDDAANPEAHNRQQAEFFRKEKTKIGSSSLLKSLYRHRQLLWWREEMRDHSTIMYFHIRMLLLETGRRMQKMQLLRNEDDVFFLRYDELFDYFKNKQQNIYLPLIDKNKIVYRSFRNFKKPNEIWQKRTKQTFIDKNAESYSGLPCSAGSIEGEVCVIKSILEIENVKSGCILVTCFTDPAWTPVFSKISGLITETGGMLSHGAVVSREYGIPAVLAIKGITDVLKSGQRVRIDGNHGQVVILK